MITVENLGTSSKKAPVEANRLRLRYGIESAPQQCLMITAYGFDRQINLMVALIAMRHIKSTPGPETNSYGATAIDVEKPVLSVGPIDFSAQPRLEASKEAGR
jgi:hypothetical protein